MSGSGEAAHNASAGLPRPLRTISDEFRELQSVVSRFQSQLDAVDGTIGLHPLGPVNVEQAQASFSQACKRLRSSLVSYRDTTLASWNQLFATGAMQHPHLANMQADSPTVAATKRMAAATQELGDMRKIADTLHQDIGSCQKILVDAAGEAISRALADDGPGTSLLLIERLKTSAKRLGLAHYTDVQNRDGAEVTTVTLAGGISVIDVDIGATKEHMKVKISYVSDIAHDQRIDVLMLGRLQTGDIHGFEKLVDEMAELDRLTKEKAPANFIHNTFAVVATLAAIQQQELAKLDDDFKQVLKRGSGIALPYMRHVGPSTMYYMPPAVAYGLSEHQWTEIAANNLPTVAELPRCMWLDYVWEPSNKQHCFLSATVQQHCVDPDHMAEESAGQKVLSYAHPTIEGLEMRFLEFAQLPAQDAGAASADAQTTQASGVWIPYTLVARLAPELLACALTVRGIMLATGQPTESSPGASQDSPRLLEDAPTLERLIYTDCVADNSSTLFQAVHRVGQSTSLVKLESPQIRAWSISRIPITSMHQVLAVAPLLRRQAMFNELLASCFSTTAVDTSAHSESADPDITVSAKTFANDPFRIDIAIKKDTDTAEQGVALRVSESTEVLAWTHQALGVSESPDLLVAMSGVSSTTLTKDTAHKNLSRVADLCISIPIISQWLQTHPQ
ncbi:hypothetical protein LPJ63_001093 [Coemansia sp. RSA 2711]|nr:hypothetical protein LPJ63_001093 [Coemansia sp. RSA 2711]